MNARSLKILIASRKLFSNWMLANIRYILAKYGLISGNITVKCDNNEISLTLGDYWNILEEYYSGLIDKLECNDRIYAILNYKGYRIRLYDAFSFLNDIVNENFFGEAYDDLDVNGKTVVDIGAGLGDTAILFSLKGARRVLAFEPYPFLYKKALVNIKANNLEDRVVLVNAGVGSTDGLVCAEANEINGYYYFKPSGKCDIKIKMYTLASLIREYDFEEGSILKMDCEGCEYEVLQSIEPREFRLFSEITIEYHNGYNKLVEMLESVGFKTYIKPIRSTPIPTEKQGYIVAQRLD